MRVCLCEAPTYLVVTFKLNLTQILFYCFVCCWLCCVLLVRRELKSMQHTRTHHAHRRQYTQAQRKDRARMRGAFKPHSLSGGCCVGCVLFIFVVNIVRAVLLNCSNDYFFRIFQKSLAPRRDERESDCVSVRYASRHYTRTYVCMYIGVYVVQ